MNSSTKADLIKCVDFVQREMNKQANPSFIVRENEVLPCYRDPHGRKCPAGHLIPDSEYDISMEHNSADEIVKLPWINDIVGTSFTVGQREAVVKMVNLIQRAHDDALDKWWESRVWKKPIRPEFMPMLNSKLDIISFN